MSRGVVIAGAVVAGFVVGAMVGFAWSTGTKSALSDYTKTTWSGGKATVEIDVGGAASAGLRTTVRDWLG